MVDRKDDLPEPGKAVSRCIDMLLEEIQQAIYWSRPSILIAVHKSKNDQSLAISSMEKKLAKMSIKTKVIAPEVGEKNILVNVVTKLDSRKTIYFIHSLGNQMQTYTGLNMYRELIVEQSVKIIFWMTLEEMILLSRFAPDFWSFRHRVIEFPTGRSSKKNRLPAGILLWHQEVSGLVLEDINQRIAFQEGLLQNLSSHHETSATRVQEIGILAYYYWLTGETQKSTDLLKKELKQAEQTELADLRTMLLNSVAINCYDESHYYDALHWIDKALENDLNSGLLWANHGIICRSAGQGRKSLSSLKKAVKLTPTYDRCWGVLGYTYMSLGKYQLALLNFKKALTINPGSIQYLPAMAVCQTRMGDITAFEGIMNHLSEDEDGYLSVCRNGLLGNTQNAISQLKELILDGEIPQTFVRRDPNLHFIFGLPALQELVLDVVNAI